ncbi:MAG: bifunctional nicotinamidase/pyrazinamidase [Treponema sp.]|jgi:nicotinamidase/pyrazinamidase|nr:bifunctional nicotinamidase/pyrazinamidase [Treponema sp.]
MFLDFLDYKSSVLIIVDVQNDFCPAYTSAAGKSRPDGALAVAGGGDVCAPLNAAALHFIARGGMVIATQDWHPKNHASFASAYPDKRVGDVIDLGPVKRQILWPDHCIQGSQGACFHDCLNLEPVRLIIRKGTNPALDSYSAFFENDRQTTTGLDGYLQSCSISTVFLGGLAADYCVLYSAMDALRLHYRTYVFTDATRGVDFPKGSVEQAYNAMELEGVSLIKTADILQD